MSQNIQQVYTANPTSEILSTDLIYVGKSPFGIGDDSAINGKDLKRSLFNYQNASPILPGNITLFNPLPAFNTCGTGGPGFHVSLPQMNLPNSLQLGQQIIIMNINADPIDIKDFAGNTIVAGLKSFQSAYLYVDDVSTPEGGFEPRVFGSVSELETSDVLLSINNLSDIINYVLARNNLQLAQNYLSYSTNLDLILINPCPSWIDINTTAPINLKMPAMNVITPNLKSPAVGQRFVIRNLGTSTVQLKYNDNSNILNGLIASGSEVEMVLSNNATSNGVFIITTLGSTGALLAVNNLSDVVSPSLSRNNLQIASNYFAHYINSSLILTNPCPTWIDISVSSFINVTMPAMNINTANVKSPCVGTVFTFRNVGSSSFQLKYQDGTNISLGLIAPADVVEMVLSDNSSANGIFLIQAPITPPVTSYNITDYMVGQSLADAPYVSINAAITAASSSASAGNQQFVYIQTGTYTENVVMQQYVHLVALDSVLNQALNIIPAASTVTLQGTIDCASGLTNMDAIVQGITIITVPAGAPAIQCSNSFVVTLNLKNCVVYGSHNDAVLNTNPNFILNIYNSSLQAASTRKIFNFTQGNVLVNNSNLYTTDTASVFGSTGIVTINNSYCSDSFVLSSTASLNANGSTLIPPGTLTAVNLSASGNIVTITNCTITSGSPSFAISGVSGATFKENLNVYTANPLVQSTLTTTNPGIHIGNMSFDNGVYYVKPTSTGNSFPNFNSGTYKLGLDRQIVSSTPVSMTANSEYLVEIPGNVHLTLPVTAAIGDIIHITGLYLGGIHLTFIDQNASQSISIGSSQTTAGITGQCYGSTRNSITLQCLDTDTTWICIGIVGTYTLT